MITLIKTISVTNCELSMTSGGVRSGLLRFTGRIEIKEHTSYISILGEKHKGIKTIKAFLVLCENPISNTDTINTICAGGIFNAVGDVPGAKYYFDGLEFVENDPLKEEFTFEIKDCNLIKKLMHELL